MVTQSSGKECLPIALTKMLITVVSQSEMGGRIEKSKTSVFKNFCSATPRRAGSLSPTSEVTLSVRENPFRIFGES